MITFGGGSSGSSAWVGGRVYGFIAWFQYHHQWSTDFSRHNTRIAVQAAWRDKKRKRQREKEKERQRERQRARASEFARSRYVRTPQNCWSLSKSYLPLLEASRRLCFLSWASRISCPSEPPFESGTAPSAFRCIPVEKTKIKYNLSMIGRVGCPTWTESDFYPPPCRNGTPPGSIYSRVFEEQ